MKKTIEVAVSQTKVKTILKEIEFPETCKYYKSIQHNDYYLELFAILPMFKKDPTSRYRVVQISRNEMTSTDFEPDGDCKVQMWIEKNTTEDNRLRKQAYEFIVRPFDSFEEISEQQFKELKTNLLNDYEYNILK